MSATRRAVVAGVLAWSGLGCSDPADRAPPRAHPPEPLLVAGAPVAAGVRVLDEETLEAPTNLVRGTPATSADGGEINVVVEIPAGTSAKFEADPVDGKLRWERRDGVRRVIDFLPYPANYGFVPRTLSAAADGGDGDPLDVFLLGPPRPRGAVVRARLIGALRALDDGEQDDKLLAIPQDQSGPGQPFGEVTSMEDMKGRYRQVVFLLCSWLASYDEEGQEGGCRGVADRDEAGRILDRAMEAFGEQARE